MTLAVLALVLVAAGFHAAWNAMLKAAENPLALATRALTLGTAVSTPVVALAWFWHGRPGLPLAAWLLALISGGLELVYFIALSAAYRRGELSAVYPIARGTAPLLAVAVGLLFLGEQLHRLALAGIACLLGGLWAVRRPSPVSAAFVPAVITGVLIAAYSSIDRVGVRLGPPWLYGWVLWVVASLFLLAFARLTHVPGSGLSNELGTSLAVGVLMTGAYFLILIALSFAPLAIVAPLRESAIVLVTAWGIWRLEERRGTWLRVGGAVSIVAGIALLTFG